MSKSDLSPIEQTVQSVIQTYFDEKQTPKFVIGVSGGPDSMALLHVFYRLDVVAHVIHINYGKRGRESDKDADLVEHQSKKWNIDCQIIEADPAEADNKNFQQWARRIRYAAFEHKMEVLSADGIALAHHQDDQIETILQKQFRGAALESWSAMHEWNGHLLRPFLSITKKDILEYCQKFEIPYRTDASNLESDFARNFLRNKWLPQLEEFFPGWQRNVLRMADKAELHARALEWISVKITDQRSRIIRNELLEMDTNLLRAVILHMVRNIRPEIEISASALHELDELDTLQTGRQINLTKNFSLMRDRKFFKIVYEKPKSLVVAKLTADELAEKPFRYNGITFKIHTVSNPDFETNLYLDVEKLDFPITLRRWNKGDRFRPFGMEGHQNVSEHLTNRKISAAEKKKALVIESFEETICAVIFPPIENRVPPGTISEEAKCDSDTQEYLIIKPN